MDSTGSAVLSPAASTMLSLLRATEARGSSVKLRADGGRELVDEAPSLVG